MFSFNWMYAWNIVINFTVMILSFRTDRSGQTVQTQRSSLIRVYTLCNSDCIFWMHYFTEKPPCSTFRVITAAFSGVRMFGSFAVFYYCFHVQFFCLPQFAAQTNKWAQSHIVCALRVAHSVYIGPNYSAVVEAAASGTVGLRHTNEPAHEIMVLIT